MGQYYAPTIQKTKKHNPHHFYARDYSNGSKLTEHSFFGNTFVNTVLNELQDNPQIFAWVGDYAEEKDLPSNPKLVNAQRNAKLKVRPNAVVDNSKQNYVFNHSKKEYINLKKYQEDVTAYIKDNLSHHKDFEYLLDLIVHPVPLLTSIGNGRGGGDYWEKYPNYDKCGYWAGDVIEICDDFDDGYNSYTELNVLFIEAII